MVKSAKLAASTAGNRDNITLRRWERYINLSWGIFFGMTTSAAIAIHIASGLTPLEEAAVWGAVIVTAVHFTLNNVLAFFKVPWFWTSAFLTTASLGSLTGVSLWRAHIGNIRLAIYLGCLAFIAMMLNLAALLAKKKRNQMQWQLKKRQRNQKKAAEQR